MIAIILSDDGKVFRVIDPSNNEDITESGKYECNALVVQTENGEWKAGFHIGTDCTKEVAAAEEAVQGKEDGHLGDGVEPAVVAGEGRYGRG